MNTIDPAITGKAGLVSPTSPQIGLVVSPKVAMVLLDVGRARLYEMIGNGELDSYLDGASRKITVESIQLRILKKLNEAKKAA